jgi:anti-repressor protein
MNEIQLFNFEGQRRVRVVIRDGGPWFVAKDVCDILGMKNSRDAVAKFPSDERSDVGITDTRSKSGSVQKRTMERFEA